MARELNFYLQPEKLVAEGKLHPYYDTAGYDPGFCQVDTYVPFDRAERCWRYVDNLKGPYQEGVVWEINIDFPKTVGEAWIIHNNTSYHMVMPAKLRTPSSNLRKTDFLFQNLLPIHFKPNDSLQLIVKLAIDEHGLPRYNPDQGVRIIYRVKGKKREDFGGLANGIKKNLSYGYNNPPSL